MTNAKKLKILHADDSWFIRQLIKKFLESENFEYIEAQNGREAYDKIVEFKPDCVLLDLLMPDLTGEQVLEKLVENNLSLPSIILSADVQKTTLDRCLELGAFTFLNKPPKKEILLNSINSAIKINQNI